MGIYRSRLLEAYEQLVDSIAQNKRKNLAGQFDLFGGGGDQMQSAPELQVKNIPEFTRHELMTMEKETTGLYLTGHPMDEYRDVVKQCKAASMGAILSDFAQEGDRPFTTTSSGSPWRGSSPPPAPRPPATTA